MTEHFVAGLGEVGSAILKIFNAHGVDKKLGYTGGILSAEKYKYLHICFPWSDDFINEVQRLQFRYMNSYTIIHSTVPVGTCRKCLAISSPVRGLHPDLIEGIKTFPKFLAGNVTNELANEFRRVGLKIIILERSESGELGKLLDTEYYRACIEFAHRAKSLCENFGQLSFHEVYTLFNQTYNEGYTKLGHPEFVRPVLQAIPGDIGGHCVVQNSKLL